MREGRNAERSLQLQGLHIQISGQEDTIAIDYINFSFLPPVGLLAFV
jgi:hypothetical protein